MIFEVKPPHRSDYHRARGRAFMPTVDGLVPTRQFPLLGLPLARRNLIQGVGTCRVHKWLTFW
jgi:hypothetical protein